MQAPDVVVIGAATRDLDERNPRGWLMGGGVTYGALTLARLGIRVGVLLGLEDEAGEATELDMIRDAGAGIVRVPLERGPIFRNDETPTGRIQTLGQTSDPIPVEALPEAWKGVTTWLLAPVAAEIPDGWAAVPPEGSCVALAWQGILRVLRAGEIVRQLPPGPSALLARSDIVSVSHHDIPGELSFRTIGSWLRPDADLLLTAGLAGGLLLRFERGRLVAGHTYPSVASRGDVDMTGAGDTMLGGFLAARIAAGDDARRSGRDLFLGAIAASALVEGPGLGSVPFLEQLRQRFYRPR